MEEANKQDLYQRFVELENKYTELHKEHTNLLEEYKENVIIQSMNEMKERYERLLKTSVPKIKYEMLSEKYLKVLKTSSGCTVILDHTTDLIHKAERSYSTDFKYYLSKIESDLLLVKDLLEESIKNYTNANI
jgi:hypothetical protein